MPDSPRRSPHKLAISIAILLILALHAMPIVVGDAWRRTWPFLMWAMYKDSRPPGPILAHKRQLIGTTAAGRRALVTAEFAGLPPPAMARMYVRPMLAGDSSAARRLLGRLNRSRTDPFVELRLGGELFTVTTAGVVAELLPVLTYRLATGVSR
jgi:hypothetical protein